MQKAIICQCRNLSVTDLAWLQAWVAQHCHWSRHRLACELCRYWNWRTASGQIKTFAARSFLLKMQQRGFITLPPLRVTMRRPLRSPAGNLSLIPTPMQINTSLAQIKPLTILNPLPSSFENECFEYYLARYHYLGFNGTVGENLKYLIRDCNGHDLACLLFGSAAWKTAPRDAFIGWNDALRQRQLNFITNNTRFLILPWVKIPHLASHILGLVLRRLRADWQFKYGHPIHLVETFVQSDRFRGTCYQAANWLYVGQTTGRSRQDRHQTLNVPVKDIYLYPLISNFREALCHVNP